MMRWLVVPGTIAIAFLLLWLAGTAEGQPDREKRGCSAIQVNNGALGERTFMLATTGDAPTPTSCIAVDQDVWEVGPGDPITVTYAQTTGGTPPPDATEVELSVNIGTTSIEQCSLHAGAPPANPTTFTFYATDNCLQGGTPRGGVLALFIVVVQDQGVLTYTCDSNGSDMNLGPGVSCTNQQRGFLRVPMEVVSWTRTSPPSGTAFAYGTAGDESVSTTITLTEPFESTGAIWRFAFNVSTTGALVEQSPLFAFAVGDASETRGSVIDDTYPEELGTYRISFWGTRVEIPHTGAGSSASKWVINATTLPSGVTSVAERSVSLDSTYQADPRIVFDADGTGPGDGDVTTDQSIYNRIETVTWDTFLLNARDEQLTRSTTFQARDVSTDSIVDTHTGVGPNYGDSFVLAATDPAVQTRAGEPYRFRASGPDQEQFSDEAFRVSSLYLSDAHTQAASVLDKDDFPNENNTEEMLFISGDQTIRIWCHIDGIRGDNDIDTSGGAVRILVTDTDGGVQFDEQNDTGADGWTPRQDVPAVPPTGVWTVECSGTQDGNSWRIVQDIEISSPFTGNKLSRIFVWPNYPLTNETRVWVNVELSDSGVEPDAPPEVQVKEIATNGFTELPIVSDTLMTNAVNFTATVNGSLYFADLELPAGNYSIRVRTFIQGTGVRDQEPLEITMDTQTAFEETTGMTALEWFFFPAIAFAAVWVWSHSRDTVQRTFAGVVVLGAGMVHVLTTLGSDADASLFTWLGSILAIVGAYMVIRTFYDAFMEAT